MSMISYDLNTSLGVPGALAHSLQHPEYPTALKIQNGPRGQQNGLQGLERGPTPGYWTIPSTFT